MTWLLQALAPFQRTIGTIGGLVVASILTSGTGFVFWWIAARAYPPEAVGLAGAAVSAMLLLSQIAMLGLGMTLAGILHNEQGAAPLILTALVAVSIAGAVLGLAFGWLAPLMSPELAPIAAGPLTLIIFAAGVSFSALGSLLDQILIAMSHNALQLLRNAIFAFSRLPMLAAVASVAMAGGMAIYGVWLAGTLLSFAGILIFAPRGALKAHAQGLRWGRLRELARGALSHHVLNLSRSSSIWLLPVLVTVTLSREANAGFYVALLLANFIARVTASATFTLYLGGVQAPDKLWRQIRFTLALTTATAVVGTLVLAAAGRPLLGIFGGSYADAAYPTVALLALGTVPMVVKDHWIAIQRIHGGVGRAAVIGVGSLSVELTAAAVGARLAGIEGLAIAWLVVIAAQAVLMAPAVYRAVQRPPGPAMGLT